MSTVCICDLIFSHYPELVVIGEGRKIYCPVNQKLLFHTQCSCYSSSITAYVAQIHLSVSFIIFPSLVNKTLRQTDVLGAIIQPHPRVELFPDENKGFRLEVANSYLSQFIQITA